MKRSTDRILTTHAGSLPRPPDVRDFVTARSEGQPVDEAALQAALDRGVAEVVRLQIDSGVDSVNDGELAKSNFSNYARERLGGFEIKQFPEGKEPPASSISGRDMKEFPEYFEGGLNFGQARRVIGSRASRDYLACTGPLRYVGQEAIQADVARFKKALHGMSVGEAFLPAVAPGTIEHWLKNDYYSSDEEYVFAIADAMHDEYKAIVDGGFVLQIDDPDLADGWQLHPEMSVADYRKFAELRIDALNHALRDLPREQIRFHMCWGSYHGPHKYDIPLKDIVDIILKVKAECYSIESSNPCHAHEWQVWEAVKLPGNTFLVPGVVGHYSDFIEHPELVAERLVQYAKIVGRENVVAGTDCGLGNRVGHPSIVWAKFQAMAEGARIASQRLWG
jgi:5-methyltetrahydropteroyltriglutamate--homocysteine methyltransferase